MTECIRHDGHVESQDPRKEGQCAACGRPMPMALPEHVDDLFNVFAEVAEHAGAKKTPIGPGDFDPEFEAFKTWTLARVRWGQTEHGEGWRGRPMPREAIEELLDCVVYAFAQMVKDGERSGDLFDATTHVYRAFLSFRQYEARQKGSV